MNIEILHFEGCAGFVEALNILERIVAEEGLAIEVVPVLLNSSDWSDFPGSPTILVDGQDLLPTKRHDVLATSCRIYATPEGPKNHPTAEMVREALLKRWPA